MSNDFSISTPYDELADAKHEAYKLMYDKTARDIKITKYAWPAWEQDEPSPAPTSNIVWRLGK